MRTLLYLLLLFLPSTVIVGMDPKSSIAKLVLLVATTPEDQRTGPVYAACGRQLRGLLEEKLHKENACNDPHILALAVYIFSQDPNQTDKVTEYARKTVELLKKSGSFFRRRLSTVTLMRNAESSYQQSCSSVDTLATDGIIEDPSSEEGKVLLKFINDCIKLATLKVYQETKPHILGKS